MKFEKYLDFWFFALAHVEMGYRLVGWLGFMAYQPFMGYFIPNLVYVYI